jgi:hypothetical protein
VVNATPRPLYPWERDPIPIVQEARLDPGPVWTDAENLAPTGIRCPDRPSRSESLYRLRHPGPPGFNWYQLYRLWLSHAGCHGNDKELGLWVTSHPCFKGYDAAKWKMEWTACCSDRQTTELLIVVRVCKTHQILQNLTVAQLVKISPAFYRPQRFPLPYTLTHILNQINALRCIIPHFLKTILILWLHSRLGLPTLFFTHTLQR